MKQTTFWAILAIITIISCNDIQDEIITQQNVEAVTPNIKEGKSLDESKIFILDELVLISKGRNEFIKSRTDGQRNFDIEKFIIDETTFNENSDKLFAFFKSNKITYKLLLMEVDSSITINNRYDKMLTDICRQIDRNCNEEQNRINVLQLKYNTIMDSLATIGKELSYSELIILYPELNFFDIEYNSTGDRPNCYCPYYLEKNNTLKSKVDVIDNERVLEIKKRLSILSAYKDFIDKLPLKP